MFNPENPLVLHRDMPGAMGARGFKELHSSVGVSATANFLELTWAGSPGRRAANQPSKTDAIRPGQRSTLAAGNHRAVRKGHQRVYRAWSVVENTVPVAAQLSGELRRQIQDPHAHDAGNQRDGDVHGAADVIRQVVKEEPPRGTAACTNKNDEAAGTRKKRSVGASADRRAACAPVRVH